MAIGDIWEATFVHRTINQQNMLNVVHYRTAAEAGASLSLLTLANGLSNTWGPEIKPLLPGNTLYQGCLLRGIAPIRTVQIASNSSAGPGTLASEPLPSNVSALISIRSFSAPPKTRGRLYMPATDKTGSDADGKLDGAYKADVETFALNVLQTDVVITVGVDSVTLRPVIFKGPTAASFYPIDLTLVRSNWASQVRRRPISRPDTNKF